MAQRIVIKGDTSDNWLNVNPVIPSGEMVFEVSLGRVKAKVGDGIKSYSELPYLQGGAGGDIELAATLTETVLGKALDATMGKELQDTKYPKLQNGNGIFLNISNTVQDLVGMGFSLSGANLSNAYLYGAELSNANLSNAYLDGAELYGANLSNAYLYGAELSNANLSNAYLSGAELSNANLQNTVLSGARLDDVRLIGATGLDTDVNIALFDVNKNPKDDGFDWYFTWTDGDLYRYNQVLEIFELD